MPAPAACIPPASPVLDEFALLDSIFADLDGEALDQLQHSKPTITKAIRKPLCQGRTSPSKRQRLCEPPTQQRQPLKGLTPNATVKTEKQQEQPSVKGKRSPSSSLKRVPLSHCSPSKKAHSSPALRPTTKAPAAAPKTDDAALLDGVEWSDGEEDAKPVKATSAQAKGKGKADTEPDPWVEARKQPGYVPISQRYTRCIVNHVTEKKLKNFRREKTVYVEVEATAEMRRVILYDEWAPTVLEEGDVVNIIGTFAVLPPSEDPSTSAPDTDAVLPTCVLSYASENLLILHPDTLISATRASDAPVCSRKAIVQEKIRGSNDYNPSLVYGNLLHELFQSCLLALEEVEGSGGGMEEAFSIAKREKEIDRLLRVPRNVEFLFMIGVELDAARIYLREKSLEFGEFAKRFVGEQPKPDAYLHDPRSRDADPSVSTRFALTGVHDIEEDIWSPRLGLKGKVDASIAAYLHGPKSVFAPLGERKKMILPFEIKTGRDNGLMQHRAQTMLYTQMMSDRYDRSVESGLLYYTQKNSVIHVQAAKNEVRGLIMSRNDMARYLTPPKSTYRHKNEEEDQAARLKRGLPPSYASPKKRQRSQTPVKVEQTPQELPVTMALPQLSASDSACIAADRTVEVDNQRAEDEMDLDEDDAMWADLEQADLDDLAQGFLGSQQELLAKPARKLLPDAIDEEKACNRCYAADGCMLYRRAVEKVKCIAEQDSPLQENYSSRTGHLTDAQCEFFEEWERLITLEEREMNRFRKEMWTMTAMQRQKHGRCLANMIIDPDAARPVKDASSKGRIHRYTYRMVRSAVPLAPSSSLASAPSSSQANSATQQSLLSGQISVGDPVLVSAEPALLGLGRGFVLELTSTHITLGLDHCLTMLPGERSTDIEDARTPRSSMSSGSHGTVFRIDRDELQSGMGRIRDNLAKLFYARGGDEKRRSLVVDLESPRFEKDSALQSTSKRASRLNEDQLEAVNKVLTARDYALILGMPGTGKTTTIAEVIKALLARGKTILLTSYTHSAVDSILMKLEGVDESKILRLGNADRVLPALAHLTLDGQEVPKSIAQLEDRYFLPQIVATTALSIDHPLFTKRKFDYCIVDEASQITLPTCLGPLRFADRFVLVGDHNQLPPLVKSVEARDKGLETSLFKRLSEAHPQAVVYLKEQYRMNEDIMSLSNRLVYNDRLKCGNEEVAKRGLTLPKKEMWESLDQDSWVKDVLQESRNVVFVNTDGYGAPESRAGNGVQNENEGSLVVKLTEALLACGVSQESIGVITVYRQQIRLLAQMLQHSPDVEVLTADKSQGRDKECVLMSLVRSNAEKKVGELLLDWRRLNVCFTRAKSKLVIFGSRSTLEHVPLLSRFFELVDEKGWTLNLPQLASSPGGVRSIRPKVERTESTFVLLEQSQGVKRNSNSPNASRPEIEPAVGQGDGTPRKAKDLGQTACSLKRDNSPSKGGCAKGDDTSPLKKTRRSLGRKEHMLGQRPVLQDILNSQ